MSDYVWGSEQTQLFFSLSPDIVLDAVESAGIRCNGRCLPLNSMENRVFDVELLELEPGKEKVGDKPLARVVKFYRPGRWTLDQIREEHEFLLELFQAEIPVIPPLAFPTGETIREDEKTGIFYALFPKMGGRAPEELSDKQLERVGRLLARVHNVGVSGSADHRLQIDEQSYGFANLDFLLEKKLIPFEYEKRYATSLEKICEIAGPWFDEVDFQRIHGDCHLGNFLWRDEGPLLLDFDDMLFGPCVQDLWLLIPGRDEYALQKRKIMLDAYETMRSFDTSSLRLVEVLRSLRFVHFSAWIGKRWEDPSFQNAFSYYGSYQYWEDQTKDMEEQLEYVEKEAKR